MTVVHAIVNPVVRVCIVVGILVESGVGHLYKSNSSARI